MGENRAFSANHFESMCGVKMKGKKFPSKVSNFPLEKAKCARMQEEIKMGERTKATSSLPKPNPKLRRVKPEPESTTLEEGKRGGGKEYRRQSYDQIVTYIESSLKRGWRTQKK